MFFEILGQNGPTGVKKGVFWGKIGYAKKCIFLKNTIFKLDKNPPKHDFWVNNELRKKLERNPTKNFSPRPYWFSPVAHWIHWE